MARKRATQTVDSQRRRRGHLDPDIIVTAALELAEGQSVDGFSVAQLCERLGTSVTSVYWYFHTRDELVAAMARRVLTAKPSLQFDIDSARWRESLAHNIRQARQLFLDHPVLIDLVLVRREIGLDRFLGVAHVERALAALVDAGLSAEQAASTLSALILHLHISVLTARMEWLASDAETTTSPKTDDERSALSAVWSEAHHLGLCDDHAFEFGLTCILDKAKCLIG